MSTYLQNKRQRDRAKRKKLREKLLAEGVNEQLVEKIIEQQRHKDLVGRLGLEGARDSVNEMIHRQDPDDAGFQPVAGDPLLRGPARVSGITAKVVKRRDTITEFQYRKIEEGDR